MQLYLIRHAHAVTAEENPLRPLSERGRAQVAWLVDHFRKTGSFRPDEIWCSHLVRSRETASLLTVGLNLGVPLLECPDLEPEADPQKTVARVSAARSSVAIVGHEPHLGLLASLLLQASLGSITFKKGATLTLERRANKWVNRGMVSPEKPKPADENA